jgi:hypothetical protein
MDFGRALFGRVGGTLFALIVAFSCFGAVNGKGLFYSTSRYSKSLVRLIFYDVKTNLCCWTRGLSPFIIRTITFHTEDAGKRGVVANCDYNNFYPGRRRISRFDQLLRGGELGLLLFDCQYLFH